MLKQKSFRFAEYDLIGFSLDHTIVKYDFNTLVRAQYHSIVEYLIKKKSYPPEYFGKISENDISFVCRGTFIDTASGNFLKVDSLCQIIRATNGTRPLSPQEIKKIYGKKKLFRPLVDYVGGLFKTYSLKSAKVDCYMDYHQCASILVYAKTVDFCRDHKLKKKLKYKTLWADIGGCLQEMSEKNSKEWDVLMPTYELKTDPRLALWLAELRKTSSLMLITSCTPHAADLRMTTAFSPKWRDLFDFVVYKVDTVLFFRDSGNFCDLDGHLVPFTGEGEYAEGSIDAIDLYMKRELKRVPKILYAGAASLHDILAPRCDVLGLIGEIADNPYFLGLMKLENAAWILSKIWGQLEGDEDLLTIWGRAIEEKTKLCAPGINYFVHQPISRDFHPYWLEAQDTFAIKELVKEKIKSTRSSKVYLEKMIDDSKPGPATTINPPKEDEGAKELAKDKIKSTGASKPHVEELKPGPGTTNVVLKEDETKKIRDHQQSSSGTPKDTNRYVPTDNSAFRSKQTDKSIAEDGSDITLKKFKEKMKGQGTSYTDVKGQNTLEANSDKFIDMMKEKTRALKKDLNASRRNVPLDNLESDSKQRVTAETREKSKHHEPVISTFVITLKVPACLRMAAKQDNSPLNLSKYDFIGFDLDNTLCTYNLKNLFTNHYNYLSTFLNRIEYKLPTELTHESIDFISRGLIIDVEAKNLLKVTADGEIVRASHGTTMLSTEDIVHKYGKKKKWKPLEEVIAANFMNWKSKSEMYSFMDFTDAAVTAVYALAVDSGLPAQKVWFDVIEGVKTMYGDEDWLKHLLNNHKTFMNGTSKKVIDWIKELKKTKKIALITSNYPELVPKIATACLGSNWEALFDVIIYDAKKPGFFSRVVPFSDLDGKETTFTLSGRYSGGCMRTIQDTLAKELNREPLCLYFGDSPYHDFMFTEIDYIAIIEELKAEGIFPGGHPSADFLSSTIWGPYLHDGEKPTIFGKFALNAKFCAPDLDFFAERPIKTDFVSQLRGISPGSATRGST
ncbi:hypothetical protein GE061_012492 [Apolygus lucorum]|uniref:5'-nucleotidase domain-containing protein 1 n=1 Tax=Apolygus lucorum TaxID=248454 RepID=A0A8S9XWI9_APOLU|nr:hypothetical protein GE061_012492 [Apolygus lucorum]